VTKTIVNEKLRSEQKRSRLAALRTSNEKELSHRWRQRAWLEAKTL